MSKRTDDRLPIISRPLLASFQWFVARYLARNFHTLALHRRALSEVYLAEAYSLSRSSDCSLEYGSSRSLNPNAATIPWEPTDSIVVYANHASWWDPLAAMFIAQRLFGEWAMYAPIDADALRQYGLFGRMGFFGIERNSARGAADFLRMADRILSQPGTSLWMTPEGRFADVRDTSAELMPGLAHLAWRLDRRGHVPLIPGADPAASNCGNCGDRAYDPKTHGGPSPHRVWFIPLAVEYTFWEERRPELLMRFGQPLSVTGLQTPSKQEWDRVLTQRLREAQVELTRLSVARDAAQFEILLGGSSGTFWLYDWWRRLYGLVGRRHVQIAHGQKFNQR